MWAAFVAARPSKAGANVAQEQPTAAIRQNALEKVRKYVLPSLRRFAREKFPARPAGGGGAARAPAYDRLPSARAAAPASGAPAAWPELRVQDESRARMAALSRRRAAAIREAGRSRGGAARTLAERDASRVKKTQRSVARGAGKASDPAPTWRVWR